MKKVLLIESHYLGCLEYYSLLFQYDEVLICEDEPFVKQTYRNRAYILTSNAKLPLIVPVSYSSGIPLKEVKVDQNQRWVKDHWGAIYSAYGKAPFFDYFGDYFYQILFKRHTFLIDLNQEMLILTLRLLQSNVKVACPGNKRNKQIEDSFLNLIIPKKPFSDRNIYHSIEYSQLFGEKFSPNLSVLDLLMCKGLGAHQILSASFLKQ